MSQLQQLAERVERLLLRHEETQRTNALLAKQVHSLTAERDSLKSRLSAARNRIDHLIDKLPRQAASQAAEPAAGTDASEKAAP